MNSSYKFGMIPIVLGQSNAKVIRSFWYTCIIFYLSFSKCNSTCNFFRTLGRPTRRAYVIKVWPCFRFRSEGSTLMSSGHMLYEMVSVWYTKSAWALTMRLYMNSLYDWRMSRVILKVRGFKVKVTFHIWRMLKCTSRF